MDTDGCFICVPRHGLPIPSYFDLSGRARRASRKLGSDVLAETTLEMHRPVRTKSLNAEGVCVLIDCHTRFLHFVLGEVDASDDPSSALTGAFAAIFLLLSRTATPATSRRLHLGEGWV